MSQLFASGGQTIGASASATVLPMNSPSNVPIKGTVLPLISFRIDWFDLLTVQRTLKNLLQRHSSKVLILQHSAFFNDPTLISIHDYWKNHSFDRLLESTNRTLCAPGPRRKEQ